MWIFVLLAVFTLAYYFISKPLNYWKNRNVAYVKPSPLFGNLGPLFRRQRSIAEIVQQIYDSYPDHRYFGAYQFLLPTLILKDPELIKKVTVKEFETFPEHRTVATEELDPILAQNIFFMKGGEKWHTLRSTLSPAFTSSKLRIMFNLMQECADHFIEYFKNQNGVVSVEMKDAFTRYANDVVASTAFGITCNSLRDKDNEFYLMGAQVTTLSASRAIKLFMQTISPTLAKVFNMTLIPRSVKYFFVNIIRTSIRLRNEKGIVRPDMIYLLMEARKEKLQPNKSSGSSLEQPINALKASITDEEIAAQAFGFFLAGFETSATAMCFAAYELGVNLEIQRKLQKEVDEVLASNDGTISYETLISMTYMDQVVSETLRKWPPNTFTDRKSVSTFTIEPKLPHEELAKFEKGTVCWIPIYGIHRDPRHYQNPDLFDPERFNKENVHKIKPFTYIPFGMGPKNCIGSRFALLETKLILFKILRDFTIIPIDKTVIPIVQKKSGLFLGAEGGFWLGLQPRS